MKNAKKLTKLNQNKKFRIKVKCQIQRLNILFGDKSERLEPDRI